MDQTFVENFKEAHIAAWNEKDPKKRDALLNGIYHQEIKMYDPNMVFNGLSEISDLIGKPHADDPHFFFKQAKAVDFSHNRIRLFGHIGTRQNPAGLNSMDFFLIENGKASHLYVFMTLAAKD